MSYQINVTPNKIIIIARKMHERFRYVPGCVHVWFDNFLQYIALKRAGLIRKIWLHLKHNAQSKENKIKYMGRSTTNYETMNIIIITLTFDLKVILFSKLKYR